MKNLTTTLSFLLVALLFTGMRASACKVTLSIGGTSIGTDSVGNCDWVGNYLYFTAKTDSGGKGTYYYYLNGSFYDSDVYSGSGTEGIFVYDNGKVAGKWVVVYASSTSACTAVSDTISYFDDITPLVTITASSTFICDLDSITLSANVPNGKWTIYDGSGHFSSDTGEHTAYYTLSAGNFEITYTAKSMYGICGEGNNEVNVLAAPLPPTKFTVPSIVCSGTTTTFTDLRDGGMLIRGA